MALGLGLAVVSGACSASHEIVREGEDSPGQALAAWKSSMSKAEATRENLRVVEARFTTEGLASSLLKEYQRELARNDELLGSALLAARRYARFESADKFDPLSQTLDQYLQIAGKSRYMGERYQLKPLLEQAERMKHVSQSICEEAGWSQSGIPACRARVPAKRISGK